MKVELTCAYCNKSFLREAKSFNRSIRLGQKLFYCNLKCVGYHRVNSITFNCYRCGRLVTRPSKSYNSNESGRRYCSHSCSQKINNLGNKYNYKTGFSLHRKEAFTYYGERCTVCGYSIKRVLEIHHRNGDRTNNRVENLDVLCPTHHTEYHKGIRKYAVVAE